MAKFADSQSPHGSGPRGHAVIAWRIVGGTECAMALAKANGFNQILRSQTEQFQLLANADCPCRDLRKGLHSNTSHRRLTAQMLALHFILPQMREKNKQNLSVC